VYGSMGVYEGVAGYVEGVGRGVLGGCMVT